MRDFALNLISFSYEKILHEKMGNEARGFIKNLSYVLFSSGIATILSMVFNNFAGRNLSPGAVSNPSVIGTGFIMLYAIHKYLKFDFKIYWAKKLVRYGLYSSLGGLSSVFYGNIDKIIIYKYLTTADIRVCCAYYFASINLVGLFIGMFVAVFFPLYLNIKIKMLY